MDQCTNVPYWSKVAASGIGRTWPRWISSRCFPSSLPPPSRIARLLHLVLPTLPRRKYLPSEYVQADERRIEEVHAKLLVAQEGSADESNSGRVHAGSGAGGQIENGGSKKAAEGTIVSGDRLPPASPGA